GERQASNLEVGVDCELNDMNIRVMRGIGLHFRENRFAFGVVDHSSPCQNKPAMLVLAGQTIGVDDAEEIAEAIESGDLKNDRFVARDGQPIENALHFTAGQVPVFVAQRVNGWIDQILRNV